MSTSRRRVTAFMAIGVIAACLAGLAVWKLSLPSSGNPYTAGAIDSQTESTPTPTPAETSSPVSTTRVIHPDEHPAGEDMRPGTAVDGAQDGPAQDPLLPPNAVVNPAPRVSAPTQVYRPTNVAPSAPAMEPGPPAGGEATPKPASTPEGTTPSGPTTPGATQPGAPTTESPASPQTPNQPQPQPGQPQSGQPQPGQSQPGQAEPSRVPGEGGGRTVPGRIEPDPQLVPPEAEPTPQGPAVSPGSNAQNWWSHLRERLNI
ncbi:hypothetical protein [Corynebacterium timonense]|uniref:Uncharacterized protein n=1 Tax=Corynebacterium timonense TaxID=441500 RepID=A0A1H1RSB3_9CORY|nr:hypothetical protein [Corynebacterium timonense]SDS38426.1 hypothetical protein SAMN04488539_1569 [Corynebacterium timonense]